MDLKNLNSEELTQQEIAYEIPEALRVIAGEFLWIFGEFPSKQQVCMYNIVNCVIYRYTIRCNTIPLI